MRKLDIYVFITIIVLIPLLVDPEGIILPFFIASSLTWLSICIILPFFIASSLTWLSICIILPFFIASSLTRVCIRKSLLNWWAKSLFLFCQHNQFQGFIIDTGNYYSIKSYKKVLGTTQLLIPSNISKLINRHL